MSDLTITELRLIAKIEILRDIKACLKMNY